MGSSPTDRRLRVLTLVDGIGTWGGGETLARQIAIGLDPERFEPIFCVTRWEHLDEYDEALAELEAAGVRFIGLDRSSRVQLKPWRGLMAQLREDPVDVIHSHKIGSNIWGSILSFRLGIPVFVAHEHTWSWKGQPQRKLIDRFLIARRADAFVAVSEEDRRRMIEIEHVPEEKAIFIPNGIVTPAAPDPNRDFRSEQGIEPDRPLIGIVAVLRPQKALDVMVRAMGVVVREFPEAKLVMVGSGDSPDGRQEERELQAYIDAQGLTDSIEILGRRYDVPEILDALDVAALSSDYEGSPLSVMEYMEAGVPVAATRVGGLPDLVIDGETGYLVEPQDPEALGGAISDLLRDPERARQMGAAGRERRRQQFSVEETTRRIEELYSSLSAKKDGGA